MNIKYCLPIIKETKQEVLRLIEQNRNNYHYFEVWLEYVKDFDFSFLLTLRRSLNDRLVIVLRRKNLDRPFLDPMKRLQIIGRLEHSNVLIDLDIYQHREELTYIKKNDIPVRTIASYHNYEKTPALALIVESMILTRPAIIKVATRCNKEDDAIRLLQLLLSLKRKKQRFIILGMGEYGTITRVFGTLWGNEMIFAPKTLKDQSAEGQLTKKNLERIFTALTQE